MRSVTSDGIGAVAVHPAPAPMAGGLRTALPASPAADGATGRGRAPDRGAGRPGARAARRVLFVGAYPPQESGTRAVSEDVAARLATRGWQATLVSRAASRLVRPLDQLLAVWRARRTCDVAVLDVYSGAAFRWAETALAALRGVGIPVVLALHGGNLPHLARQQPARVQRLLRRADAVVAPSSYLADAMRAMRPDVRIVPNPIELPAYEGRVRRAAEPRLVWLRAFHRIYDPVRAAEVIARLSAEFPNIALTMVGPDKDGTLAEVRAAAARLGVAERVACVGAVAKTDVPARLAAGDVFLNTTTIDNTPVSVLEAMATGLCVVSTNVGGLPHLLTDGADALLVPAGDTDALADAVRRVLRDPALAERLSRGAIAHAATFGWDAVLPQWETVLDAVARARRREA